LEKRFAVGKISAKENENEKFTPKSAKTEIIFHSFPFGGPGKARPEKVPPLLHLINICWILQKYRSICLLWRFQFHLRTLPNWRPRTTTSTQ
jgi:hypothetical protein